MRIHTRPMQFRKCQFEPCRGHLARTVGPVTTTIPMKRTTALLALLGSLLLSTACTQEPEAVPQTPEQQPAKTGPKMEIDKTINPLTGQTTTQVRITELPSDAFFQEHYYPGAKVIDVKEIFGIPTVLLSSTDDYDKIDAFYKKKFTAEDGTVQGREGSYYRMTSRNRMEKAAFNKKPGGICEIALSM